MMKRDDGLAAALFAIVIGGAVAIAIASDVTAPLCAAAKIKNAAPDKIEFGCFEFWMNRYQTLLAAIFAVVAAVFTIRATRQQTTATAQTNENVARVFAYDALRAYSLAAFEHIRAIDKFDDGKSLEPFDEEPPVFRLSGNRATIAHLPRALVREIFQLERAAYGEKHNRRLMMEHGILLPHLQTRSAIARRIIMADDIAKRLGSPLDLYEPLFDKQLWQDIRFAAEAVPQSNNGRAEFRWIIAEQERRRALR